MFFEDLINGQQIEQNHYLTSDRLALSTRIRVKFVRADFHFMLAYFLLPKPLTNESFTKLIMDSCWTYSVRIRSYCYLYHFLSSPHI
jgi:hypothetical protein